MEAALLWIYMIIGLVVAPLASIIFFLISWGKFRDAVPFTEEKTRRKRQLIIAGIIAGIFVGIYVVSLVIYGATVYFA